MTPSGALSPRPKEKERASSVRAQDCLTEGQCFLLLLECRKWRWQVCRGTLKNVILEDGRICPNRNRAGERVEV